MTDHTADGAIQNPAHADSAQQDSAAHDAAPLVPESSIPDDATAGADAPKEAAHAPGAAKQPSKEITLQRLTPQSSWEDYAFRDETIIDHAANAAAPQASHRRLSIAAIVTIAAAVGAIGGSLATTGVGHYLKGDQAAASAAAASASAAVAEQARSADSAIAKLNAEIAALKSSATAQSAKLAERIEKVEKAQAEPAAKLAKLSETVDKLRAPAPAPAAPETTGSVKPAATQPNRLPVVEGWSLREVYDGVATVVGRNGIFDVIPGDPLPGVGRVDAIRRQDGRWVVVTSRGLIITR